MTRSTDLTPSLFADFTGVREDLRELTRATNRKAPTELLTLASDLSSLARRLRVISDRYATAQATAIENRRAALVARFPRARAERLRAEAGEHRDWDMVGIVEVALYGTSTTVLSVNAHWTQPAARAHVVEVLVAAGHE